MPGIKASANRASCQKYAVCGRDFNRGGIFETSVYEKRQDMSDDQYGIFLKRPHRRPVNEGSKIPFMI
ncbi:MULTISPECIES: hypothetical protein [unclassified Mesorhizobium]|uniref:hypothetical protein n=1 Tax=unclassified Mesorhizobium TaxID=325217 RepID=UPI00112E6288|nr:MULTISPECIES: hypothetical protein [unclassified Mesorhizobium]TPM06956.1 hypothetical protein FJ939_12965 [Mesorhizobium sp. B2-3-8]TPM15160.1 hypothetical protein FJ940_13140 [Mesorhizobium sp. B2-3-7]